MILARAAASAEEIDSTDASGEDCLSVSLLQRTQKADGGWGFHVDSESRVEPTCWALLALLQSPRTDISECLSRGLQFLKSAQLPNGSWPAVPGQQDGSWVTSLACWVLLSARHSEDPYPSVAPAFRWLCDDWPKDTSAWRRILVEPFSRKDVVNHNPSFRGWGWTPKTASWVEPTSFALIAMSQAPQELLPRVAKRRQRLAQSLLCDRMCPGGGWNCGNPRTYGVAGEPLVSPTVWALIALRNQQDRTEVQESLAWLENNLSHFRSSASLALARICLETYGRKGTISDEGIARAFGMNEFPQDTSAVAWACLACNPRPNWLLNRPENG